MFRVLYETGAVVHEGETCTGGMEWLIAKAKEYEQSYVKWFEPDGEPGVILTLQVGNQFWKLWKEPIQMRLDRERVARFEEFLNKKPSTKSGQEYLEYLRGPKAE